MFEGEYEKAYQILHSVYDAEDPRMLMETANLLELAIRTERRKEAKELLKIMGKNSISRIIPLHFHYSITGTISEELEAISLLGIYDDKTLSELDTFALQFVVDKRESFLMAEHISDHIFLTCKRSMVFFPSKDIPKAIEYWEILQDFIKTQKFTALSEHLRPFVNEDLFSSIDYENKDESEITSGYIEAVISAEAHLFRARFIKDPSLIFLLDTIAETFMLLSDGSPLADLWYEEAQKNANAKNAFDLQYDMGRFGQKPVFH